MPEEWNLHETTRRCRIEMIKPPLACPEVGRRMAAIDKVLCIVNTRKDAKAIYEALPKDGSAIHLSRLMCPSHVKAKIEEIKRALADPAVDRLRVVSTQLIEAGVDLDFPVVMRQEAGLDSVLQAAGRCNREGKLKDAQTYVFKLEKKPYGDIGLACDALNATFGYFQDEVTDWDLPASMREYFLQRYFRCDTFDKADIHRLLEKDDEFMFATASSQFKLIEENTRTVIVNYGESYKLMNSWKFGMPSYSLRKKILQYGVNIHERDFNKLMADAAVEEINDLYYIPCKKYYCDECGLILENIWLEESLII